MKKVSIYTSDKDVIEEINTFMQLWPNWELVKYTNFELMWQGLSKSLCDLYIADFDDLEDRLTNRPNFARRQFVVDNELLVVYLSSLPISSRHGKWAKEFGAIDYLQKPINLDRLTTDFAIANGPSSVIL